jgi:hypothetical protein
MAYIGWSSRSVSFFEAESVAGISRVESTPRIVPETEFAVGIPCESSMIVVWNVEPRLVKAFVGDPVFKYPVLELSIGVESREGDISLDNFRDWTGEGDFGIFSFDNFVETTTTTLFSRGAIEEPKFCSATKLGTDVNTGLFGPRRWAIEDPAEEDLTFADSFDGYELLDKMLEIGCWQDGAGRYWTGRISVEESKGESLRKWSLIGGILGASAALDDSERIGANMGTDSISRIEARVKCSVGRALYGDCESKEAGADAGVVKESILITG